MKPDALSPWYRDLIVANCYRRGLHEWPVATVLLIKHSPSG